VEEIDTNLHAADAASTDASNCSATWLKMRIYTRNPMVTTFNNYTSVTLFTSCVLFCTYWVCVCTLCR